GSFAKLLATNCLAHPVLLAGLADFLQLSGPLLRKLPPDSGLRLKLGLFLETPGKREEQRSPHAATGKAAAPDGISIFPGCLAHHLRPEIAESLATLLAATGKEAPHTPEGQSCCGLATYSAGNREEARRLARQNLDAFASGSGPIVTPCGSCYSHLHSYQELLGDDPEYAPRALAFVARLREMSEFLAASPAATPSPVPDRPPETLRVFYHDPCHLRFQPGLREAPRLLLRAKPGAELVELPEGPRCCGLGGTFNLAHPKLSQRIGAGLAAGIIALAPDLVVTSCSGCLIQLHRELAGSRIKVMHLASFLA
ncbi:MAG TPA: (Fe-S)-binding protein, partial [Desulfurivibrionaceae bacterium]|nr:(Fe-S)-binding protein [Desulfurivibrionaceae bacterium]